VSGSDGLDRFAAHVDPDLVREIRSWRDHPQLHLLLNALQAHTNRGAFLDTYAEAIIASRLVHARCDIRFEVPTPSGRACDFAIEHRGHRVFLHIKRVVTGRSVRRKLTVSSRLRYLERIRRPYVVGMHWDQALGDKAMQHLVSSAAQFIQRASVGDELRVVGEDGVEIGAVRIVAPWEGEHVTLAIGLPGGFIDEAPRIRKLMRKAYQQFMPSETNIILICTSHSDDEDDFKTALLGTHIERWDRHPPRGRRVAHGRGDDGFWHDRRYADSQCVGWFAHDRTAVHTPCTLWFRAEDALGADMQSMLRELLESGA
jgi:hypothetical protein